MRKRNFCYRFSAFLLLATFFVALSTPCAAQSTSKNERRFKQIYFAAIRQKQKKNNDAEYELLKKALKLKPNASEAIYEMATLYQILYPEEPNRAILLLEKALKIEPKNSFYKEELAQLYTDTRQEDKAIKMYEDIAKSENDPTEELSLLVQLYETRANYVSALKTLDRLIRINGDNNMYLMEKMRLYKRLGKDKKALNTTINLAKKNPNNLNIRVLLGDNYLQNNDTIKALNIYQDVLKNDSNQQSAQVALMRYYNRTQDQESFFLLRKQFLLNPKVTSKTKIALVSEFILNNKKDQVYNTQEKIIDLMHEMMLKGKPENKLTEFFSAYLYTKKILTQQSIPLLHEILKQQPENIIGRLQMLQINMNKKDYEACKKICLEGILYNPSELMFYYYGGIAQTLLNNYEDALKTIKKGLSKTNEKSNTQMVSNLYSAKGDILHELKQKDAAYAAYDSCLIYNNGNIQCLNNYAYFLSLEGKNLEKAEEMSFKVIKAEPDNAIYLDTYAWILFCRNKMPQAKDYIDKTLKTLKVTEESANIYEHAGDIYSCNNLKEEAVRFWKKAKALGANSKLLKKKIKKQKYIKK